MKKDFKLTGPEFQVEILRRMGYKEKSPRCKNCKHYNFKSCGSSECLLIPLMNMKIDDDAYCDYWKCK